MTIEHLVLAAALVLCLAVLALLWSSTRPQVPWNVCRNGQPLSALRVVRARGLLRRAVGLLNHLELSPCVGLLLPGTRAIHARGLLFPIDVVFLGREGRITRILRNVEPGAWHVHGPRGTRAVLELAAGASEQHGLAEGQCLTFTRNQI